MLAKVVVVVVVVVKLEVVLLVLPLASANQLFVFVVFCSEGGDGRALALPAAGGVDLGASSGQSFARGEALPLESCASSPPSGLLDCTSSFWASVCFSISLPTIE